MWLPVPLPARGRVAVVRLQVSLPLGLYEEVEQIVKQGRRWLSAVDFVRWATGNEVERWKSAGHRLPEGPGPADLVDEVRRERRRVP